VVINFSKFSSLTGITSFLGGTMGSSHDNLCSLTLTNTLVLFAYFIILIGKLTNKHFYHSC